jgi:DNA-binding IclR family transcriptional regulator
MLYAGAPDSWIERLTLPLLKELADQTEETCFFARLGDLRIHSVAFVTPENTVRAYVVPGRELWPHAAASAKAILAFQNETIIRAALEPVLPKLTDRTKTRLADVLKELAEVRRTGIAYCVGEDFQGFAGIACPVHIESIGVKYSVAITGTVDSLIEKNRTTYEALLRPLSDRVAAAIEVHLAQASDAMSGRKLCTGVQSCRHRKTYKKSSLPGKTSGRKR